MRLRDDQAIDKLDAEFQLGRRAVGLDAAGRKVLLDGGERVAFDALVIATGVTPRRLPGDDLEGVHVLRTLDDALALRADLLARPKVVVVGAGFLGVEVAAVARTVGLEVTLVDPLPVPMRRQFGDMIGKLVGQTHSDHGVALRLDDWLTVNVWTPAAPVTIRTASGAGSTPRRKVRPARGTTV